MRRHLASRWPALGLALLIVGLLLASCAEPGSMARPAETPRANATRSPEPDYWPTTEWRSSSPEAQRMDAATLDAMFATIASERLGVHGVVVVRNGYIVAESYYPPFTATTQHVQFSVTKSFTSTLVGIALDQEHLPDVESRVADLLGGDFVAGDERKSRLTLDDLLTMRAGLDWRESDEVIVAMARTRDWARTVLDLPMSGEPGERFNYCSGCSHVLSTIVQKSTGRSTQDFARTELLAPLGVVDYRWETDPRGLAIGGWGLWLTPRDMAKLGYLYLNGGRWEDRQIVSSEWVARATTARTDAGDGWGYGYQWWVNPKLGAYFARGRESQVICVVPAKSLVVVFTANMPDDRPVLRLIEEYVLPAAR